jgi:hypothetical protein
MNIKNISSPKSLIRFLNSATDIIRNTKYHVKEVVEDYIGLSIATAYFYGRVIGPDNYEPLPLTTTVFDSDEDIVLVIEGNVKLDIIPVNEGAGDVIFEGSGSISVDGEYIYSGGGGGVPDAPSEGGPYGRQDGDWVEIVSGNATFNKVGGIKMSRNTGSSTTYISFDGTDTPNVT